MLSARERSARRSTFVMFVVAGWLPAAWATRIPAIKTELGLSDGGLALAILGLEAGAILGLPTGAALVARIGSRHALPIGFVAFAPALLVVGLAGTLTGLAAALAVMALANSIVDVAMNAQGVELERAHSDRCCPGCMSDIPSAWSPAAWPGPWPPPPISPSPRTSPSRA